MRFTLWQRIFVYTIGILVVSQMLAFFLHQALYREDIRRFFATSVGTLAAELEGQSLEMVMAHVRLYWGGQHTIWLTNDDGSALPGMGFTQDDVLQLSIRETWNFDGVTLVEVDKDPKFWGKASLRLREGTYWLFMSFGPPSNPMRNAFLFQLFAPVLSASVVLALWMAWSVSRPLRRLRDEVSEMAATGPGCKVTVTGKDEIGEVANAVNVMAEALARHVRGMRALLANVSHELRSPLARANLALGIVEESLPQGYTTQPNTEPDSGADEVDEGIRKQKTVKYLTVLQEELNHMDTLIGTTLLTQKLDMQQESVPMETVDFSALCEDIWFRYKTMFRRHGLTSAGCVTPGMVISGNKTLLLQLLANLLDNCLKYTSRGGEVRFTLRDRSDKCLLCVENSHEGMDEAALDHIFDPFYRIDQAVGTGAGLGLSLVQKTVQLHGGEVMAVPTDLGLCLCIQLPLAPRKE